MLEVFLAFLKLGLTSFGGPIAHIGYFHREFVGRRRWLDEAQYAQLLAISQFLPGPASSQVGFSVGLIRAGWLGGLAAFVAFTLPSALLLFAFAAYLPRLQHASGQAVLHGLKLVAVAVVAQGFLTMARRLTPDIQRILIAASSTVAVLLLGSTWMQLAVVAGGAALGTALCRGMKDPASQATFDLRYSARAGGWLLAVFALLLSLSFLPVHADLVVESAKAFYRAGALVFGGAHVVLPLLEEATVVPGWIPSNDFFAGYGAAQAVPGPMFSVAAYLGARINEQASVLGSLISVLAIFLPGLLLVAGVLPMWQLLTRRAGMTSALAGINAAVVGLLAAALYDPIWTSAVRSPSDFAIALGAFALLYMKRASVLLAIVFCLAASLIRATWW